MTRARLVSVVTAAYDVEAFAAETIASVQAQSLGDWEMLVVDDSSTDRRPRPSRDASNPDSGY